MESVPTFPLLKTFAGKLSQNLIEPSSPLDTGNSRTGFPPGCCVCMTTSIFIVRQTLQVVAFPLLKNGESCASLSFTCTCISFPIASLANVLVDLVKILRSRHFLLPWYFPARSLSCAVHAFLCPHSLTFASSHTVSDLDRAILEEIWLSKEKISSLLGSLSDRR